MSLTAFQRLRREREKNEQKASDKGAIVVQEESLNEKPAIENMVLPTTEKKTRKRATAMDKPVSGNE